jgi:transcriptional regulator with XRE-family HTH domain
MLIQTRRTPTPEGISLLSKVLQATLTYNRWTERELARKADISPGSANRYVNGRVIKPQDEILKKLAPYIYVVTAVTDSGVEINPTLTYGNNWTELERIVLDGKLIKSYSLSKHMEILQNLIIQYIERENINEEEFARRALLHPTVIRAILYEGNMLGDDPVVILSLISSVLQNPQTGQTFTGWVELAEYCKFPIEKEHDSACDNSGQNHVSL